MHRTDEGWWPTATRPRLLHRAHGGRAHSGMHATGVHAWWCTGGRPALVYPGRVLEEVANGYRRLPEDCHSWPFGQVWLVLISLMGNNEAFAGSVPKLTMFGSTVSRPTACGDLKTGPEEPEWLFWVLSLVYYGRRPGRCRSQSQGLVIGLAESRGGTPRDEARPITSCAVALRAAADGRDVLKTV